MDNDAGDSKAEPHDIEDRKDQVKEANAQMECEYQNGSSNSSSNSSRVYSWVIHQCD
jgi:hypothetical protein